LVVDLILSGGSRVAEAEGGGEGETDFVVAVGGFAIELTGELEGFGGGGLLDALENLMGGGNGLRSAGEGGDQQGQQGDEEGGRKCLVFHG